MRDSWARAAMLCAAATFACATSLRAQTFRGVVTDASNAEPVPLAGIYLMDRERNVAATAMADSLGRYVLSSPEPGEYVLVAQRFGYLELESPLVAVAEGGEYALDFELPPEPLGLAPITVTVRNEELVDWLTLELGVNPMSVFGFRIVQGPRLQEAKMRGKGRPTETLRWLYIPVWHGGRCVSINSTPRPQTVRFRGARVSQAPRPGEAPSGTSSVGESGSVQAAGTEQGSGCGSLYVDDRKIPNEHIEDVDMSQVVVVVTLPGTVRMYTYEFEWSFRQ